MAPKKSKFKPFNPENVDKIEAKEKEKSTHLRNNQKSHISLVNPIERNSPSSNEEHNTKKPDNVISNDWNEYTEHLTVKQTPILDMKTSENSGILGSKAPAYPDNSQWLTNEEKPSVSRKGSYPSLMNMDESQESGDFSHAYESQHVSDETSFQYQSRSKEFRKNRLDKNNYNKNESNRSGKNENYQRNSEKSTNNWEHQSTISNFKSDTPYTHDDTGQTEPTKSRGNRDQKGAVKKTDFYSRDNTDQDYRNRSTSDNTYQKFRNRSTKDNSNQENVNRITSDNPKQDYCNRSNRDTTQTADRNGNTSYNSNQDYRNRTAKNNTNQNYQNTRARDNTSQDYGNRRDNDNKDHRSNRNRYNTSQDYGNSSSRGYTRRNENTQNDRQENSQESIHENQQMDDSWESANINWNSGVDNMPNYDSKDKGNNSMLESSNLAKDKQWKSLKKTEGIDDQLKENKSNNNYGFSKFVNRKSDSFQSYRSEKTDGSRYSSETNRSSRFSDQSSKSRRSMESYHPEYAQFISHDVENLSFEKVIELEQDLFEMPEQYSLGHCVAADMRMGSGIAVIFKRKFNSLGNLLSQGQGSGGLAILENKTAQGKRYIYYLVTKWLSSSKPIYEDFFSSLIKFRDHVHENGVKKVAIPKIGCGLDRLEWGQVKRMLAFLFRDVDVEITVCNFQQAEEGTPLKDKSCKVVFNDQPVAKIDDGTVIIYFSTEKGEIEEDVYELSKEFNFLEQFKKSKKMLGDAIKYAHTSKYYILYGCIVRKTRNDCFDFESFEKCLLQINKNNRKDEFYYVAYQSITDKNDSYINDKIITLLRNVLRNVEVYVCKSNRAGDTSIEE